MNGARCHISKDTQDWLDENGINYISYGGKPLQYPNGYPPNSLDLNSIENVFSYWHNEVIKKNPKNTTQLIQTIKQEWNKIPMRVVRNCIKRLPKVMEWIKTNNGKFYNE